MTHARFAAAVVLWSLAAVFGAGIRADEPPPAAPAAEPADAAATDESPGQADLDDAVEAKMTAKSPNDFGRVLDLCRQALEKGLDEEGRKFADDLYTGTLVDRAGAIVDIVYATVGRDPQWLRLRALARRDLDEIIERNPKLGQAHLMVARLEALPQGDSERAGEAARRALELLGDDPLQKARAHVVLAGVAEDAEARRKHFDDAVELAPADAEIRRARAAFLIWKEDFAAAREDLEAAIAANPEDAELHQTLGMALAGEEKLPEARRAFDRAIELAPRAVGPLILRARLAAEDDKLDEALADLDRVIELAPNEPMPRLLRAQVRIKADDEKSALEDVEAVLRAQPDNPGALEIRGLLAASRRDFAGAIRDFRRLVAKRPDDPLLVGHLGTLYMLANQPRKAIERFTRALELDDENFVIRRSRSDAEISIGDHEAALADLEVALTLKPDDPGVLNNLAWLLATSPVDELRDGARAIELATKACEVTEWKEPHIISTLAAGYAEQGDFETAKKYSRQALEVEGTPEQMLEQLRGELVTYEEGKPCRERQQMEDEPLDEEPAIDLGAGDDRQDTDDEGDTVTVPDQPEPAAEG